MWLQVLLVEHEGETFAYKEYICVNAGDANALAGVAQEANAEFKSLSEVYHGADITVSPAGNEQRNVIKPVRLVTVPSNGNHVSGFLMEPLDGEPRPATESACCNLNQTTLHCLDSRLKSV